MADSAECAERFNEGEGLDGRDIPASRTLVEAMRRRGGYNSACNAVLPHVEKLHSLRVMPLVAATGLGHTLGDVHGRQGSKIWNPNSPKSCCFDVSLRFFDVSSFFFLIRMLQLMSFNDGCPTPPYPLHANVWLVCNPHYV